MKLSSDAHKCSIGAHAHEKTLSVPRVKLQVACNSITFILDTGDTYSVLTFHSGLTFPSPISVIGIDVAHSSPLKTFATALHS